jgi:hypothetical protein
MHGIPCFGKLHLDRRHSENAGVFFIHILNFAHLKPSRGANYQRRQENGVLKILRL